MISVLEEDKERFAFLKSGVKLYAVSPVINEPGTMP
jgi:hypothetical protein